MNLLPLHAEKKLSTEYWLRVGSVWALLLSGLFVTLSLLLVPTYVLIHSQFVALAAENKKNNEIEGKFQVATASIVDANQLVDALSEPLARTTISKILDEVYGARTPDIQLRTIILSRKDGNISAVQVQGEALSRESLVQFKTALEHSSLFETATVPLSDLARDTNLPFSIAISLTGAVK